VDQRGDLIGVKVVAEQATVDLALPIANDPDGGL
jgi:hypothetical protein